MMGIGKNYKGAKRLAANLNLPPPQSQVSWLKHTNNIQKATCQLAKESMLNAAKKVSSVEGSGNTVVSCDGTWQRRGFSSRNGITTVLSIPKPDCPALVIDNETLSNYCAKCSIMKKKINDQAKFIQWQNKHKDECEKNHDGSAGSMEPAGMINIFKRSEETRQLKYVGYLGDGDSKSFCAISKENIYSNVTIEKLECCGHVQKRMGRKLMDKVHALKSKTFYEGKKKFTGIGGAGRLTQKAILRIQAHYGAAIRNNPNDIIGMKRAIWAIWSHRAGSHGNCPEWCNPENRNKNNLPKFVCEAIKPIFVELSSSSLLEKCLHGGSQNANESFHNMIWERCPKITFVGRRRLEIAVADATVVFNSGEMGRLPLFNMLGLRCGEFTTAAFYEFDQERKKKSSKTKSTISERRMRAITSAIQRDDNSYGAGKF